MVNTFSHLWGLLHERLSFFLLLLLLFFCIMHTCVCLYMHVVSMTNRAYPLMTKEKVESINQSIKIYLAPLQDTYSEALPTQAKRKRTVFRRWLNWEQAPFGRCLRSAGICGFDLEWFWSQCVISNFLTDDLRSVSCMFNGYLLDRSVIIIIPVLSFEQSDSICQDGPLK